MSQDEDKTIGSFHGNHGYNPLDVNTLLDLANTIRGIYNQALTDIPKVSLENEEDARARLLAYVNELVAAASVEEGEAAGLQSEIEAEEAARIAADAALQIEVDAEEVLRRNTDTAIRAEISEEQTARSTGDALLQTNIDTEEAARTAADTALQADVDENATDITGLTESVVAEVMARNTGDTAIRNELTAEEGARASADSALQEAISAEAQARATHDATAQTNIDAEESARIAADAAIQAEVDAIEIPTGNSVINRMQHNPATTDYVDGDVVWTSVGGGLKTFWIVGDQSLANDNLPDLQQAAEDSGWEILTERSHYRGDAPATSQFYHSGDTVHIPADSSIRLCVTTGDYTLAQITADTSNAWRNLTSSGGGGISGVEIKDEGVAVATATQIDVLGEGAIVRESSPGVVQLEVPGVSAHGVAVFTPTYTVNGGATQIDSLSDANIGNIFRAGVFGGEVSRVDFPVNASQAGRVDYSCFLGKVRRVNAGSYQLNGDLVRTHPDSRAATVGELDTLTYTPRESDGNFMLEPNEYFVVFVSQIQGAAARSYSGALNADSVETAGADFVDNSHIFTLVAKASHAASPAPVNGREIFHSVAFATRMTVYGRVVVRDHMNIKRGTEKTVITPPAVNFSDKFTVEENEVGEAVVEVKAGAEEVLFDSLDEDGVTIDTDGGFGNIGNNVGQFIFTRALVEADDDKELLIFGNYDNRAATTGVNPVVRKNFVMRIPAYQFRNAGVRGTATPGETTDQCWALYIQRPGANALSGWAEGIMHFARGRHANGQDMLRVAVGAQTASDSLTTYRLRVSLVEKGIAPAPTTSEAADAGGERILRRQMVEEEFDLVRNEVYDTLSNGTRWNVIRWTPVPKNSVEQLELSISLDNRFDIPFFFGRSHMHTTGFYNGLTYNFTGRIPAFSWSGFVGTSAAREMPFNRPSNFHLGTRLSQGNVVILGFWNEDGDDLIGLTLRVFTDRDISMVSGSIQYKETV